MYSRSYYPESEEMINIPENYDGTAFTEQKQIPENQPVVTETATRIEENRQKTETTASLFSGIPVLSGLFGNGKLFGNTSLKMPKLGTEEILILLAAAFLFFSKEGDKECGLILLFLLLIN